MEKRFPGHQLAERVAALEFAFDQLAATLHAAGQLDMAALIEGLSSAEYLFQDNEPGTQAAVRRLCEKLDYWRSIGAPPEGPAEN